MYLQCNIGRISLIDIHQIEGNIENEYKIDIDMDFKHF